MNGKLSPRFYALIYMLVLSMLPFLVHTSTDYSLKISDCPPFNQISKPAVNIEGNPLDENILFMRRDFHSISLDPYFLRHSRHTYPDFDQISKLKPCDELENSFTDQPMQRAHRNVYQLTTVEQRDLSSILVEQKNGDWLVDEFDIIMKLDEQGKSVLLKINAVSKAPASFYLFDKKGILIHVWAGEQLAVGENYVRLQLPDLEKGVYPLMTEINDLEIRQLVIIR